MGNECSCIYVDSEPAPEFYQETQQVAHIEHDCGECGEAILPGQRYWRFCGKWEGYFNTFKMCVVCKEIADFFFCDGFLFEAIYEHLEEHILEMQGNISGECLSKLSPQAREAVCDLIEQYWEESDDEEE